VRPGGLTAARLLSSPYPPPSPHPSQPPHPTPPNTPTTQPNPTPPPKDRTVTARSLASGREVTAPYDALLLAPGARAIRPPLAGIDLPGIFQL
jgi:hypothetical protein